MKNAKQEKLQTQNNLGSNCNKVKIHIDVANNGIDYTSNSKNDLIRSPRQNDKNINSFISNNLKNEITEMDEKAIIEQNYKYFQEYNKLYEANTILKSKLNNLEKEKNILKHSVNKIEIKNHKNGVESKILEDSYTNRRRKRRTKEEIKRAYECKIENCKKSYGSEGSLNQHLKLKHKIIKE